MLQCMSERRRGSYSDLVQASRESFRQPTPAAISPPRPEERGAPLARLSKHKRVASFVVKNPSSGETFYERMAKYGRSHMLYCSCNICALSFVVEPLRVIANRLAECTPV